MHALSPSCICLFLTCFNQTSKVISWSLEMSAPNQAMADPVLNDLRPAPGQREVEGGTGRLNGSNRGLEVRAEQNIPNNSSWTGWQVLCSPCLSTIFQGCQQGRERHRSQGIVILSYLPTAAVVLCQDMYSELFPHLKHCSSLHMCAAIDLLSVKYICFKSRE